MLEEMEEILDYIDLVQGNEYYIKLHFINSNTTYARTIAERYNGVYKLIEEKMPVGVVDNDRHCYELINENNIKLDLIYFTECKFICDISNMYNGPLYRTCQCKIYKINNTEYILK